MENNVESFVKFKVNYIHCSLLSHQAIHVTTEGSEVR